MADSNDGSQECVCLELAGEIPVSAVEQLRDQLAGILRQGQGLRLRVASSAELNLPVVQVLLAAAIEAQRVGKTFRVEQDAGGPLEKLVTLAGIRMPAGAVGDSGGGARLTG